MVLIAFLCLSGSDPQSSNQVVCYYETAFKSLEETKQACAACGPVAPCTQWACSVHPQWQCLAFSDWLNMAKSCCSPGDLLPSKPGFTELCVHKVMWALELL